MDMINELKKLAEAMRTTGTTFRGLHTSGDLEDLHLSVGQAFNLGLLTCTEQVYELIEKLKEEEEADLVDMANSQD